MKNKILLISFDFIKEGYSDYTYSIASIMSSLEDEKNISPDHYGVNLRVLYEQYKNNTKLINQYIKTLLVRELKNRVSKYDFIAIGVSTWSNIHVEYLVNEVLENYTGRIILGGYEITATQDNLLIYKYPAVDYFVKGYSETAIKRIITAEYDNTKLVINEILETKDLISPYLTKFLPINTDKVHWETKRGCPYSCGFCEWGNASNKKVISIDESRLDAEIEIFKNSNVKEINIIDGTYNFSKIEGEYVDTLEKVLKNTKSKITLQARFENIKSEHGYRFLELCEKYSSRIKLEFGLQTIHRNEMEVIGRPNNMKKIKSVMLDLNLRKINYEISLIFGIPGQTIYSFKETIRFVKDNGCDNIRAFPLRLPKNSKMELNKVLLGVKERMSEYNVYQVTETCSFDNKDYNIMMKISEQLNLDKDFDQEDKLCLKERNPYEWEIASSSLECNSDRQLISIL